MQIADVPVPLSARRKVGPANLEHMNTAIHYPCIYVLTYGKNYTTRNETRHNWYTCESQKQMRVVFQTQQRTCEAFICIIL